MYCCHYSSPLGDIIIASDGEALTGLWFSDQKYACAGLEAPIEDASLPIFRQCRLWLDAYFSGATLPPLPPLSPKGTEFQKRVWKELTSVGYGQLDSYGEIAERVGCKSARAVDTAIGRNTICILIPCHRIVGSKGKLTGYAGGIERKRWLLELEGIAVDQ